MISKRDQYLVIIKPEAQVGHNIAVTLNRINVKYRVPKIFSHYTWDFVMNLYNTHVPSVNFVARKKNGKELFYSNFLPLPGMVHSPETEAVILNSKEFAKFGWDD